MAITHEPDGEGPSRHVPVAVGRAGSPTTGGRSSPAPGSRPRAPTCGSAAQQSRQRDALAASGGEQSSRYGEASVGHASLGQCFRIELGQLVEAAPMPWLTGVRDAEALQIRQRHLEKRSRLVDDYIQTQLLHQSPEPAGGVVAKAAFLSVEVDRDDPACDRDDPRASGVPWEGGTDDLDQVDPMSCVIQRALGTGTACGHGQTSVEGSGSSRDPALARCEPQPGRVFSWRHLARGEVAGTASQEA